MKLIWTVLIIQLLANVLAIYGVNQRINMVCHVMGKIIDEIVHLNNHMYPSDRITVEHFLE